MSPESYQIVIGIVVIIIVLLIAVAFIFILVTYANKKKKLFLKEKQILQSQYQQSLLQSQLEIQEQTFNHISKEIHDNLGIVASVIKINLNTIQLNNPAQSQEKINETKELVKQLILDLKLLTLNLSSDRITQLGLLQLLYADVDRINKSGVFNLILNANGNPYRMEPDKEIILYRMSQEILNNAIKYSGANNVAISLYFHEKNFILTVQDDGIGFNAAELLKTGLQKGHNGLHNLQKRSALINAQLTVTSTPGKGTNISIDLPL